MEDTPLTTSSTNSNYVEKLKKFLATQKGIILAAEIALTLIVIICHAVSIFVYYSTIAICEMIFAVVFFVVFMMELDKQFRMVNWLWSDFLRAISGAGVLIIFSLVHLIKWRGDAAWVTGGVFGLMAGIMFAYDTYTIGLHIKSTGQNTSASTDSKV